MFPAESRPIALDRWYRFQLAQVGSMAAADTLAIDRGRADSPPFTVTIPAEKTDIFLLTDGFSSGAHHLSLFLSAPEAAAAHDCSQEPVACFENPTFGYGFFRPGAGAHSHRIRVDFAFLGSGAYFVDVKSPAPESGPALAPRRVSRSAVSS